MFFKFDYTAELKRIAAALEVIAVHYAKEDGRMWLPEGSQVQVSGEEPAVFHTDDVEMMLNEQKRFDELMGRGWPDENTSR